MRKLIIPSIIAIGLITSYFLWIPTPSEMGIDQHPIPRTFLPFSKELKLKNQIEIEKASSGYLKRIIRAPAQILIIADKKAHILPKASGIALTAYKNLGDEVSQHEVIASLESKEMAEAKANYLTALKQEQFTSNALQREKILYEKKLASIQEFSDAQNSKEEALIDLELSRQKLYTLGLDTVSIDELPNEPSDKLRIYDLRSPIAGKVIKRDMTPGEFLTNDHEIYVVANLSKVWAEISIFAQDREWIKQGQNVQIFTNEGQRVEANVSYLSPIIDPDTRTSIALVEIDNSSERWLPGLFVQAEFVANEENIALKVKKEAIQTIEGVDVLFISTSDGFAIRPVTKGRSDEDNCEVISGLLPGEDYACQNTFLLKADLQKDQAEDAD